VTLETTHSVLARQDLILQEAYANKVVRIKDLAARLGVHEMTVRRDVDALAEQGILERVHGGARLLSKASDELAYGLRVFENRDSKTRIARAALELIRDGETVALDASTTVLQLAHLLPSKAVNTIVTSLDAANTLAAANAPFTLIGGEFHARARSFVGALATNTFKRLHPDKVFFSSKGFALLAGFTDAHLPETEMKEKLIRSGALVIALLDHAKFSRVALNTIADLEDVDVIVTDREPNGEFKSVIEHHDVRLIVAEA
jgi:DeoR family transcriptional regulator, fructose operon transcriptional repressor